MLPGEKMLTLSPTLAPSSRQLRTQDYFVTIEVKGTHNDEVTDVGDLAFKLRINAADLWGHSPVLKLNEDRSLDERATAVTSLFAETAFMTSGQSSITPLLETTRCASKPTTLRVSSRSNPVMTLMTKISTITPRVTPRMEISVIIERKVRLGFR